MKSGDGFVNPKRCGLVYFPVRFDTSRGVYGFCVGITESTPPSLFREYLGLYSGLGIRPCSSHRAGDVAGRNPCLPDSRTGPVFRLQTSKMTRMSKPIRQKNSSVRTSSRLLLWLKTADRQRRTAQATAHAKERPASPPPAPLPCSAASPLFYAFFCDFTEFAFRRFERQVNQIQYAHRTQRLSAVADSREHQAREVHSTTPTSSSSPGATSSWRLTPRRALPST